MCGIVWENVYYINYITHPVSISTSNQASIAVCQVRSEQALLRSTSSKGALTIEVNLTKKNKKIQFRRSRTNQVK